MNPRPYVSVRGKDEYPTTVREMILARAEAAAGGDALAAAALAADAPIDTDTAAARAEVGVKLRARDKTFRVSGLRVRGHRVRLVCSHRQ
jgi:hypothetical protein